MTGDYLRVDTPWESAYANEPQMSWWLVERGFYVRGMRQVRQELVDRLLPPDSDLRFHEVMEGHPRIVRQLWWDYGQWCAVRVGVGHTWYFHPIHRDVAMLFRLTFG